jgi:hypothetical protein
MVFASSRQNLGRHAWQKDMWQNDMGPHSRRAFRARFVRTFRPLRSEGVGNAGRPMHPQPRVRYG